MKETSHLKTQAQMENIKADRKENIKADRKETGWECMDWIHLAQNRHITG
jgi:hypothetical protein